MRKDLLGKRFLLNDVMDYDKFISVGEMYNLRWLDGHCLSGEIAGVFRKRPFPFVLEVDENGYVMFIVASPSGRIYVKKFLTMNDYNDNGELAFNLEPSDTKNLQPYRYLFSFTYFPNKTEQAYTYSTGIFEILKSLGNVDTLDEYLNPPIIEPDEDGSNETDNPDDNTTGDDVTDDTDGNETIEPDTPDDSGDDTPTEPDDNTTGGEDNGDNG